MPESEERINLLSELVYLGRLRWSEQAVTGLQLKLKEMGLKDSPENYPRAAHEILDGEMEYFRQVFEHLQEMNLDMGSIVRTNGSRLLATRTLLDDYDHWFDTICAINDITARMLHNYPRFLQASAIRSMKK